MHPNGHFSIVTLLVLLHIQSVAAASCHSYTDQYGKTRCSAISLGVTYAIIAGAVGLFAFTAFVVGLIRRRSLRRRRQAQAWRGPLSTRQLCRDSPSRPSATPSPPPYAASASEWGRPYDMSVVELPPPVYKPREGRVSV